MSDAKAPAVIDLDKARRGMMGRFTSLLRGDPARQMVMQAFESPTGPLDLLLLAALQRGMLIDDYQDGELGPEAFHKRWTAIVDTERKIVKLCQESPTEGDRDTRTVVLEHGPGPDVDEGSGDELIIS